MITSRKIEDLDPLVQAVCQMHIRSCAAEGIEIILTATYRDVEQQDALYAIGRSPDDKRTKVTNARGGESWHQYRVAWDVVPVVGGKCVWDDKTLWNRVIHLGELSGAEAGANWIRFTDRPHFEVKPKGLSIADAAVRFSAHGTIFL